MTVQARNDRPGIGWWTALVPPTVWAAHLLFLYGGHTLLCVQNPRDLNGLWLTLCAGASALAVVLILGAWAYGRVGLAPPAEGDDVRIFTRAVTGGLAALSMFGVLWAASTALLVAAC